MTIETYNQNRGIPMGAQSLASGGGGGTGGASINDNQVSTTTVYSSNKVESRLAEKTGAGLSLGFNATLANETLTFVTTDATPYTLKENYDYEVDLHFSAAGTLSDTIKMVVENNNDTIQFVALTHADPSEPITVGTMKQLMYYGAETGFRWLFKARYKTTSTGVKVFVIYPVIAKSESPGAPTNMVTTDTEQTISGPKTFSGKLTASSGEFEVGVIGKTDGTILVGTSSTDSYVTVGKSNQGTGLTTNAGTPNKYFGIYSMGYTDQTFKISGHKNLNMTPSTSFSLNTLNKYCGVSADLSSSYPYLYLKGGNSASDPSGSVKIGYEGSGTYSSMHGTFINTDSKKGPLLGKRLWIGQTNYRASITNNIGSGLTIETSPLESANNGIFTIGKNAVTFVGSDGVSHNLLDKGSSAASVPHRFARVAVPLTSSGEIVTMPATGELRIRGGSGNSVNNYITIDLNPDGSDKFSKKVCRAPITNATVSADALVYEGQAVQIDYTATEVQAYVYLLLGDARAQGYDD